MYIPTDSDLNAMEFADADNKAAFKSFIEGDKYLSAHRGEYSVRGCGVMPWHSSINFKYSSSEQVLKFADGKYTFTEPTWNTLAGTASTWSALLNVRYIF